MTQQKTQGPVIIVAHRHIFWYGHICVHDSFIFMTWLIHLFYAWMKTHSFILCVNRLMHIYDCNIFNALQRTATHCNTLQRTAMHCNALQRTATHCNALQRTATLHTTWMYSDMRASTHPYLWLQYSQRTATHCNALQCTATHCNALQRTTTHCSALQRTATHCNTLQHTATHCNNHIQYRIYGCMDSFIFMTWIHSCLWHDSFISMTRLIHKCDMTHSYMW